MPEVHITTRRNFLYLAAATPIAAAIPYGALALAAQDDPMVRLLADRKRLAAWINGLPGEEFDAAWDMDGDAAFDALNAIDEEIAVTTATTREGAIGALELAREEYVTFGQADDPCLGDRLMIGLIDSAIAVLRSA